MKTSRRRKCLCCGELYTPEPRSAHHQRYCPRPACRAASRQASQRRWLAQALNRNYHTGSIGVARVRDWRLAHPGYWRKRTEPLQDLYPTQSAAVEEIASEIRPSEGEIGAAVAVMPPPPQLPEAEAVAVRPCAAAAETIVREAAPLQDIYLSQEPLFVGLVALLTDTLQENMALQMARLQSRGQAILRNDPGIALKRNLKP